MAKLSSRGRRCQAEATREYDAETLQHRHDAFERSIKPDYVDGSDKALTMWERTTRRLMSDGVILEKRDVRFQPDWLYKDGRRHSYGWKVHGKIKAGLTVDDFVRIYQAPTKSGKPSAWIVTRGSTGAPAKVISTARLMRAVESGEYIGFCTSCGHDQLGVEPDANGYQCQSCGQMAVSGAEQLLTEAV